jgi:hypothetical protein
LFISPTSSRRPTNYCVAHIQPFQELAADLTNNAVPRYNFITPNLCDDMHNSAGCATSDRIRNGDNWLAGAVPRILASPAYQNNGAIFITCDEGHRRKVAGPHRHDRGFAPGERRRLCEHEPRYSHASTLRTMQAVFGVQPFLCDAANASDLSDLFRTNVVSTNSLSLTSPTLLTDGRFRFTLVGLTRGRTNVVEVSANLSESPSFTNVAQSITAGFTDATGDNVLKRFYRFSELP